MVKYIIVTLMILITFSCERKNYIDVQKRNIEVEHLNSIVNKSENEVIQYKSQVKLDNDNENLICDEVKQEVKQEVTFWKPDCNPLWTFDDDNCINQCYPLFNCY